MVSGIVVLQATRGTTLSSAGLRVLGTTALAVLAVLLTPETVERQT